MTDPAQNQRIALAGAIALIAFAALTALALVAWFVSVEDAWTWKSLVAMSGVLFALTVAVLLWRAPTRDHAVGGLVVLAASLARVGAPADWNGNTATLFILTFAAAAPLAYAATKLPKDVD
ncbi:hypothetical protein BH09MYX1_BH09MYX1_06510 [soil metagenome]